MTVLNYHGYNKELSSIGHTITDNSIILLKKRILTKQENLDLNTFLNDEKSYSKKVGLINDYNIAFNFFLGDRIIQEINISLVTKKISIRKDDCPSALNDVTKNPCLYCASINKNFEKFILQLISM